MRLWHAIRDDVLSQRPMLICWAPVCLATGIGTYFSLKAEPSLIWFATAGVIAVFLFGVAFLAPAVLRPAFWAVALIFVGMDAAKWQTVRADAPILTFRYYGPIEGRIVMIDRSASDALRLTLDQVRLDRVGPDRTPKRVRISLHGEGADLRPIAGDILMTTGHLSPPSGPAEPGGFDFQRHAYFAQLGAIGYTRNPVLRAGPARDAGVGMWIFRQRMALSQALQRDMTQQTGAFAAAIMAGDRSAMDQVTLADLRAANLAHLLAISGLHMGLLTGFVFALVRMGLALVPGVALRWPTKKIAACAALAVGAFYLALSGGNVATERAYIMVSVMLVAVLLDRRALTLRAVALAAIIVLLREPSALMGPGFQMSFAATTALVFAFRALRDTRFQELGGVWKSVLAVVVSSGVAGFATAPFAAAHFNQIAHYGLIANVLSVPLMGAIVVPAGVLALCLAPFGLWSVGLWIMDKGIAWILWVAGTVSAQPGALSHVKAPDMRLLGVLAIGLLLFILWQGRGRWLGLPVVAVALFGWAATERPALLIADNGALIGAMGPEGRALSRPKGSGFVAGIWLENDGSPAEQSIAAARPGLERRGRVARANVGEVAVVQVSGKTALSQMRGCDGAHILVSTEKDVGERPCLTLTPETLRKTGSVAMTLERGNQLVFVTARDHSGIRPWNAYALGEEAVPSLSLNRFTTDLAELQ